jgi:hypothetical protein
MFQIKLPMPDDKPAWFYPVGYGALALYAGATIAVGLCLYGMSLLAPFGQDDRRARFQTGRILIATEDRVQCRAYTFDNDTVQLIGGGLTSCEEAFGRSGSAVGVVSESFRQRN